MCPYTCNVNTFSWDLARLMMDLLAMMTASQLQCFSPVVAENHGKAIGTWIEWIWMVSWWFQWIGSSENRQETMVFTMKYGGFRWTSSLKPIQCQGYHGVFMFPSEKLGLLRYWDILVAGPRNRNWLRTILFTCFPNTSTCGWSISQPDSGDILGW